MIAKNHLDKRILQLEEKLNPKLKVLVVIVNKDDPSIKAAQERMMQEYNISEVPTDCLVFTINIHSKPIADFRTITQENAYEKCSR